MWDCGRPESDLIFKDVPLLLTPCCCSCHRRQSWGRWRRGMGPAKCCLISFCTKTLTLPVNDFRYIPDPLWNKTTLFRAVGVIPQVRKFWIVDPPGQYVQIIIGFQVFLWQLTCCTLPPPRCTAPTGTAPWTWCRRSPTGLPWCSPGRFLPIRGLRIIKLGIAAWSKTPKA